MTGLNGVIEFDIVFILQVGRGSCPQRFHIVDHLIGVGVHVFAIFPLLLLAKNNRHRHKAAIFIEQRSDTVFVQIFLFVVVDIHHDVGAAFSLIALFHVIFRRAVAGPFHCLSTLLIRKGVNFHLFRHHKSRVETQAKMADNGISIVFKLIEKIFCTGKSDLIDIFFNFFGSHTNTVVAHGKRSGFGVELYGHLQVVGFALKFACISECFEFLRSIYSIRYDFTKKDFVVAIKKLFNDGENVAGGYPDTSFCHNYIEFFMLINFLSLRVYKKNATWGKCDILTYLMVKNMPILTR